MIITKFRLVHDRAVNVIRPVNENTGAGGLFRWPIRRKWRDDHSAKNTVAGAELAIDFQGYPQKR
jgi:hypothetical protein